MVCKGKIVRALRNVSGVKEVKKGSHVRELQIVRDGRMKSDAELTAAVKGVGFGAKVVPTATVKLSVKGLDCSGCEGRAKATLEKASGTKKAAVSKAKKQAEITYDTRKTSTEKLVAALKKAGFEAKKS